METRTTDLIADFQARHEAWRRQGEDLARLRADAGAAASREAAAILTTTRADVSRIIVDARRALLALTAQLQAITDAADSGRDVSPETGDAEVPESVQQARRDLQHLLGDTHPDLEELAAHVAQLTAPMPVVDPPAAPSVVGADPCVPPPPAQSSAAYGEARRSGDREGGRPAADTQVGPDVEPAPQVDASTPEIALENKPSATRPSKWGVVVAPIVIAATLAGAGAWWFLGPRSDDLTLPIAFIPQAPRITPSWDAPLPTITASLLAVPAEPAPPQPAPASETASPR